MYHGTCTAVCEKLNDDDDDGSYLSVILWR